MQTVGANQRVGLRGLYLTIRLIVGKHESIGKIIKHITPHCLGLEQQSFAVSSWKAHDMAGIISSIVSGQKSEECSHIALQQLATQHIIGQQAVGLC